MSDSNQDIGEENKSTPSQDRKMYLPYECEVTESMRLAAKTYLGETPEHREKCIKELRERIENSPDLDCRTDDRFLLLFLRSRKFDVERAYNMVQRSCTFATNYRHLVVKFDPTAPKRFADSNLTGFLPYRDAEGRAILYFRPRAWDPDELPLEEAIYGGIVIMQSYIEMEANQIMGFVVIIDCKELPIKHMVMLAPKYTFVVAHGLQHCCPCRVAAIHAVNTSELIRVALKIIRPVMSQKLWKRVTIHKGDEYETLHEHIPKEILPSEYGGDLGEISNDHWIGDIAKLRERFSREFKRRYKIKGEKSSFLDRFSSKSDQPAESTRL